MRCFYRVCHCHSRCLLAMARIEISQLVCASTNSMKIAFHSGVLNEVQSGPEIFVTQLLRHLVALRPHDEFLSVMTSTREQELHAQSAARVHSRIQTKTIRFPREWWHALQEKFSFPPLRLAIGDYDVFHQMWATRNPAVPSRKLVVSMYDTVALHWAQEETLDLAKTRRLLSRAAAVLTLSEYSKSQIVQEFGVSAERVHVTLAGCDFAHFHNEYSNAEVAATLAQLNITTPYFFTIGGPAPRKNLKRVIEAFCEAKQQNNLPHKLVLAGTMNHADDEVKHALGHAGDNVQVLGYVPDEIVPHLYRGATALIFASLFEGFGLPVVEAMACGTSVMTSNVTSLPEVAGDAAILVNPTDKKAIACAIVELANEAESARQNRIARGLIQAQKFSWQKCAQVHSDVYDAVAL